jgi:CMP-N-acetylneuraminic acid synthetase
MTAFHPIALIPARAGSTRTPFKNTAKIGGRSLVQRAVDVAVAVPDLRRIYVSSDSEELLDGIDDHADQRVAARLRPPSMALADSPIEPLMLDIMQGEPDATHLVLLPPSSPFRKATTVSLCLMTARTQPNLGTVATCRRSLDCHYTWRFDPDTEEWITPWDDNLRPRSQDLRPMAVEHGACYVVARRNVERNMLFAPEGQSYPVFTDDVEAWDIDWPWQLAAARGMEEL